MDLNQKYMQLLESSKFSHQSGKCSLLEGYRKAGVDAFKNNGLPTSSDEEWLYTNLEKVLEQNWNPKTVGIDEKVDLEEVFRCDVPNLDTHVVLLINGHYFEQNIVNELPKDIVVGSLCSMSDLHADILKKYIFKAAGLDNKMNAINAALANDGLFLYIPKNVHLDKPIQIVNIAYGEEAFFINQHNLIVLEEGSSAQIAFCDHTLNPTRFFINQLTEIHLEANAQLEFYNMQNSHNDTALVSSVNVNQHRDSNFHSNIVSLHGGLIRNELQVKLLESGASCDVSGINLTDRTQHVDSQTRIDHLAPHCTSNQLYKGIYDDDATGAFTGRIVVHPGAQKTVAYQTNKNMLLTSKSKVNARPQLEIYADDVKCSHGATTGQLDQKAMFYLRARGIEKNEARMLMMYAFANEIVSKIKIEPLAVRIEGLINRRLRGELSRCANCVIQCG